MARAAGDDVAELGATLVAWLEAAFRAIERFSTMHGSTRFEEGATLVSRDEGITPSLAQVGNVVPQGYAYYEKSVLPGEDLILPTAYLKWYTISPPEVEIAPEQIAESRTFTAAEVGRLRIAGELGFVLLHRAGPVLLLLISTWRNINEVWESAYVKEVAASGGYAPLYVEGNHRGTFCVWELGPVWHERQAWVRFLRSDRGEAAKRAYVADRFSGLV
jgi:hypothetical protein